MAELKNVSSPQSTREVRTYWFNISNDIEEGSHIADVSIIHVPPSGSPTTPTFRTIDDTQVAVTVGPLVAIGVHEIRVLVIYSDGNSLEFKLVIKVDW